MSPVAMDIHWTGTPMSQLTSKKEFSLLNHLSRGSRGLKDLSARSPRHVKQTSRYTSGTLLCDRNSQVC